MPKLMQKSGGLCCDNDEGQPPGDDCRPVGCILVHCMSGNMLAFTVRPARRSVVQLLRTS